MNLPPIERLQSGDSEAWDIVFKWLWPKAINVSRQVLTPLAPSDAEDVVIEAFASLFERIHKVYSTESLPSLLVAITRNRARSHLRRLSAIKRGYSKTIPMNIVLEEQLPAQEETPLESLKTEELFNLLEQIRLELPERTARYIHEHYVGGLTHRDIAERHGVSVHTVSGNIRRGLRVLREKLENNVIFTDDLPFRMRTR